MTDYQALLLKLNQNLNILREREAKYAGNTPIELINQITDHQKAIALTEQVLAGQLTEAEWQETIKPLLVSLEAAAGVTQIAIGDYIAQAAPFGTATVNVNIYQQASPRPVDPAILAAAKQRLTALPLDTIHAPVPLPTGSRMPFSPNPLFVGREADLCQLAQTLKGGQTTAIGQIAAATGLGGIGKTQLASEFVHRYGQYFSNGVFWLSFANAEGVRTEIAACGRRDHLNLAPDFDALDLDTQVRLVLAAWQSELPRLLVFDNCEDESLLAQWRPPSGGSRVLVTSRRAQWSKTLGVQTLPLGVLNRVESVTLLRKFQPNLTETEAGAIAAELGDLPLALHLAGSFLSRYQRVVTPEQYLTQLRRPDLLAHRSLQGGDLSPTDHELHVARTFALSYDKLNPNDPTDSLALALLSRAACFAPGEPIPCALLLTTLSLVEDDPDAPLQAEDALHRLVGLGLLDEEVGENLRLHRLLAKFVVQAESDATAPDAVEAAILQELPGCLDEAGYIRPIPWLLSHLWFVTGVAQRREDAQAARLCNWLGYYLNQIGDYTGALPYYQRALAIREKVLESDHPDTANSLNNLAALLQAQGDYVRALPYYQRALAIKEKVLGPGHPDMALSLNNLAALLRDQGDCVGALSYCKRALAIREQVLGPDHPDMALSLNNLAVLLQAQGDYAGAKPYFQRALTICEKVLGSDHPDTALSLNNLAALLDAQGDYAGALPYYQRALTICEKVLGPDHPDMVTSLNNLAALLDAQGDYAGALPYYQRALTICEKVLGPDHPSTATNLNNLALLLYAQSDYAGAKPYFQRALAIREQVLGPDHPDTAISLNNLALLLYAQGDYAGAKPYFQRALAIFEAQLGPNHPNTRLVRENLAALDNV